MFSIKSIKILPWLLILVIWACSHPDYSPKPHGYFRIEFPEKKYQTLQNQSAYTFRYPTYANIEKDASRDAKKDWYNLHFKSFNGYLHLTYYGVSDRDTFDEMVEDARRLAFKHTIKASAIDQKLIHYPDRKVYGIYYAIEGNTASSVQFFLTDSVKNYFRGALYFNERPQYDSIAPVIKFIKTDIDTLIASFRWRNN